MKRSYGFIAVITIIGMAAAILLPSCRNAAGITTPDPGDQNVVRPVEREGLVMGTSSASPVITALAAELGLAAIDQTDAATLIDSVAEAAVVAINAADLSGGGSADAEAILAAARETGVPILFENSVVLDEYLAFAEAMDNDDPSAVIDYILNYEPPAEMDEAMDAMSQAIGLGVDSQLALYVPILNGTEGIVDGKAVEAEIFLLGAGRPVEVFNVSSAYEVDGLEVADADVPDPDEMTAAGLLGLYDLEDMVDTSKLTPSLIEAYVTDPALLVDELAALLTNEVAVLQDPDYSGTSSLTRSTSGYGSGGSPPAGVVYRDWRVTGAYRRWYPCDKDQLCTLRIKARVQLYLDQESANSGNKYLRILGNDSYWHMDDAQEFDTNRDQGYYMYQTKMQMGVCNSSGDWISYPSWLSFDGTGNHSSLNNESVDDIMNTSIGYYDGNNRPQTWYMQWVEEIDRSDWFLDIYTATGRVTFKNNMNHTQDGYYVDSWGDMLNETSKTAYKAGKFARGGQPGMRANHMAMWKADYSYHGRQRFKIYHKMWVRNTWWNMATWLWDDDEKKHREDHARKQYHFTVNFDDV